jgi:hypothetical protein
MTTTTLARTSGVEITTVDDAERLARIAVASGLTALRRPEEAAVILLTGRELGLAPMQSLRGIHVVQGRPVLSADLMVAIVRRSGLCASWRTVESTPEACTIETRREGEPEAARKTWTMADAARAGLTAKGGNWKSYPAQMLRHRCAADLAREVYPDVVLGLYDPDEMQASAPAQPVAVAEPVEDAPEESSRAMARFVKAVEDADTLVAVRLAWCALPGDLRAEGHDPEDWTRGAIGYAERMIAVLGWQATTAERDQVLGSHGSELCAMLDSAAHVSAEALPVWYVGHREAVAALHDAHGRVCKALVARRAAGLTGPVKADTTKAANAAFAAAVQALADAPFPREPGLDDGDPEWYASPATIRGYLAGKGTRREVENAVRKHAPRMIEGPRAVLTVSAVNRLFDIAVAQPGFDGTPPAAETLRRDVEQWAAEGPRAKASA